MNRRLAFFVGPPSVLIVCALLQDAGFALVMLSVASRGVVASVDALLPRSENIGGIVFRAPATATATRGVLILGQIAFDVFLAACLLAARA